MKRWLNTNRRGAPFAVVLCLFLVSSAAAQTLPCTKFWVDGISGAWDDGNKWKPAGVPVAADVVCILETGSYEVTMSTPATVAGIELNTNMGMASLKVLSTDLTLNGPGLAVGDTKFKVNDGAVLSTVTGSTIEVHSKLVIDGGTVEVDVDLYGHLNYAGVGSLTGSLVTHPGSTIEYEDTGADAHLVIAEGFDNYGQLIFTGTVAMTLEVTSGSFVNTAGGVIEARSGLKSRGVLSELMAEFDNQGLIDVDGVDLRLGREGSDQQNGVDGEIRVAEAELEINLGDGTDVPSNFTNYGSITVASGGSVRVNGSSGLQDVPSNFTNYGSITIAGGGSVDAGSSTGLPSGMGFVNSGSVEIDANGVLSVTNVIYDNPSSGDVRGSGTLDLTEVAAASFDGTLSPGFSPGILTIDGSLDLGTNTRIAIEVGGETPGTDLDRLDLTGALGAGGELDVVLIERFHPVAGQRFQVTTFDSIGGWFDTTTLPPLMHLLGWNVDVGDHEIGLEVICQGTQVGIELAADRDPVSVDHELIYLARVRNHSAVTATDVTVSTGLGSDLIFLPGSSSPECVLIGSTVECTVPSLAPAAAWDLHIGVETVTVGPMDNTGAVAAWECDTDAADDQAMTTVVVVAAEPCDANDDQEIDADDLVPAVGHIFGERAAGNPDCRLADGITADDLAAIIEAGQ
jgi:Domain of unknown function DUF11